MAGRMPWQMTHRSRTIPTGLLFAKALRVEFRASQELSEIHRRHGSCIPASANFSIANRTSLTYGPTTIVSVGEEPGLKLVSPAYTATILWVPAVSLVVMLAAPPLRFTLPRTAVPFMNVTLPVGVPVSPVLGVT